MISSVRLRTWTQIFSHEGLSQGRPAAEDADATSPFKVFIGATRSFMAESLRRGGSPAMLCLAGRRFCPARRAQLT